MILKHPWDSNMQLALQFPASEALAKEKWRGSQPVSHLLMWVQDAGKWGSEQLPA